MSDLRDEVVENLDEPAAIEATGGRIYIADRGVVDKIISYDVGRRFEPFRLSALFARRRKRAAGVRREFHSRERRRRSGDDSVGGNQQQRGFDPLQDGVYDENEIQINQVLFGLGTIRASVGAPEGYQLTKASVCRIPNRGGAEAACGLERRGCLGWKERLSLGGVGDDDDRSDDLARFNIASDGNGGKVASIAPVRVPNLPFENLPKLIYGGGDKDAPVGGAHYLRVGDSQMTVSRHTNPNGSFDPIGKSGESPAGIAGTVLFATESIAVDSEGKYVVKAGTFIGRRHCRDITATDSA